ncbi:MAG TPA: caspase family protein [Caldimonas sp.]
MLSALLTAATLLAPVLGARAERQALLVGVSRYAVFEGDERLQLAGPANDVQLMRTLLERRGFAPQAVRVLADGVPGAAPPTRAAILDALDSLAARASPADQVFLYFAGHGSQMPADPHTPQGRAENDGLHEIFLPSDTGRWNRATRRVDRAIADYELVERLDTLVERGAFVFAVFDTCHSATSLRTVAGSSTRWRRVEPEALGIPSTLRAVTPPAAQASWVARVVEPNSGAGAARGRFVAFYAAQTTELTPEMMLPLGGEGTVHGLFTYTLAEGLASAPAATYRQLAQFVLARYAALNLSTPTPLFTGTALDAPLFGVAAAPAVPQWPLHAAPAGARLDAGRLDGIEVGGELDILPGPLAPLSASLGAMQVIGATATSALLAPLESAGTAPLDVARLPPQAVARLNASPPIALRLRLVPPPAADAADTRTVRQAIEAITRHPEGVDLAWVGPDDPHDLRLWVAQGRLWMLPPSGQWQSEGPNTTPSLAIGAPALPERLQGQLQRVGRSLNLLRIAARASKGAAPDRLLQVQATLRPTRGDTRPIDEWQTTEASDGDLVTVDVRNAGRSAIDLTALYIDAAHGITVLYPYPRGASNRIEAGDRDTLVARLDATTQGVERLLLIAVEARPQGERRDFSFLAQPRLAGARATGDSATQLFERAAFGSGAAAGQRGAADPAPAERLDLRVFSLDVH